MKFRFDRIIVCHNQWNKWIVIVIDYAIKWFVARVIFEATFEILTDFVINDIYRDYETSKKIIIDRNVNLWASVMIKTFALLEIKHKDITFYHSKTNEIVKRFNDVLNHMLIKYCIENFIKEWNIYLNQILFVTRVRTHTTIDFSSFYLFYEVNSTLFDDVEKSIFDLYDEKINSISFLSRERAKAFKKIMQRVKKNKAVWNAKIKKEIFHESDKILIRIKKSKKFEIDWYDFCEIIRNEILNIYVFKSFEKSSNKYLISENRMKLINMKEEMNKNWRMFRDRERSFKAKNQSEDTVVVAKKIVTSKRKRDKSRKVRNVEEKNSNEDYISSSENEFFEDDDIVWII